MKKFALGAMLVLGVAIGSASPSLAAGSGLDRGASAQGNGTFARMHRDARRDSRAAMRGRMMRRHHHRHMMRRHHR